jgi:hypothetical protein
MRVARSFYKNDVKRPPSSISPAQAGGRPCPTAAGQVAGPHAHPRRAEDTHGHRQYACRVIFSAMSSGVTSLLLSYLCFSDGFVRDGNLHLQQSQPLPCAVGQLISGAHLVLVLPSVAVWRAFSIMIPFPGGDSCLSQRAGRTVADVSRTHQALGRSGAVFAPRSTAPE